MNVPRFLAIFSIALFTIIGLVALFKDRPSQIPEPVFPSVPFEIEIQPEKQIKSVVQKTSAVAYDDKAPVASLQQSFLKKIYRKQIESMNYF